MTCANSVSEKSAWFI